MNSTTVGRNRSRILASSRLTARMAYPYQMVNDGTENHRRVLVHTLHHPRSVLHRWNSTRSIFLPHLVPNAAHILPLLAFARELDFYFLLSFLRFANDRSSSPKSSALPFCFLLTCQQLQTKRSDTPNLVL